METLASEGSVPKKPVPDGEKDNRRENSEYKGSIIRVAQQKIQLANSAYGLLAGHCLVSFKHPFVHSLVQWKKCYVCDMHCTQCTRYTRLLTGVEKLLKEKEHQFAGDTRLQIIAHRDLRQHYR